MAENNYLGKGRVGKLLMQFAVPSTLAPVISCLYNIAGQIFGPSFSSIQFCFSLNL